MLRLADTRIMKLLKSFDKSNYREILDQEEKITSTLSRYNVKFPNYTQHDIQHSLKILEHIYDITSNIENFDQLEIELIILSGLYHDVGMASNDKINELIKKNEYQGIDVDFVSVKDKHGSNALQEILRSHHGLLSNHYISKNLESISKYLYNYDDQKNNILSLICESHTKSITWIQQNIQPLYIVGDHKIRPCLIAYILRIGDLLDFDKSRVPKYVFETLNLGKISKQHWDKQMSISNKKKVFAKDGINTIVFDGHCYDANIHRAILAYIDVIEMSIYDVNKEIDTLYESYYLNLSDKVRNRISTPGFKFSNITLDIDYNAITKLLMGKNIYGDNRIGLREIIQNSIDACLVKKEIFDNNRQFGDDDYVPKIDIIIDKENDLVVIRDNGLGMDIDTIYSYFINIGKSYYKSDDYLFKGLEYKPIGTFGIGFLACFMLSDEVKVETCKYNSGNEKITFEMMKQSKYITLSSSKESMFEGTKIYFKFSSFMEVFGGRLENIKSYIEKSFILDDIKVRIHSKETIINLNNSLNSIEHSKFYIDCSKKMNAKGYIEFDLHEALRNFNQVSPRYTSMISYIYNNDVDIKYVKSIDEEMDELELLRGKYNKIRKMEKQTQEDKEFIINYDSRKNANLYKFEEITGRNDIGLFNEDETQSNLYDSIVDKNYIEFLDVPLLTKEQDEKLSELSVYNSNMREILMKMDDISWTRVFSRNIPLKKHGENKIDTDTSVLEKITFSELYETFGFDSYKLKNRVVFFYREFVYCTNRASAILKLSNTLFGYGMNNRDMQVFLKRVLLERNMMIFDKIPGVYTLTKVKLNIESNQMSSDVSRSSLIWDDSKYLGDAINYTVLSNIVENRFEIFSNSDIEVINSLLRDIDTKNNPMLK